MWGAIAPNGFRDAQLDLRLLLPPIPRRDTGCAEDGAPTERAPASAVLPVRHNLHDIGEQVRETRGEHGVEVLASLLGTSGESLLNSVSVVSEVINEVC